MPLGYSEDDDELQDLVNDDGGATTPYSNIARGAPLDNFASGKNASNNVMNTIAKRKGIQIPMPGAPSTGKDYANDPLMQQYEKEQKNLTENRQNLFDQQDERAKAIAFGQIGQQLARGSNSPDGADDVTKTLSTLAMNQPKDQLKSQEEDLDRRQKVVSSIEARQAREAVANNTNEYRKVGLMMRQNQMDSANQSKNDRLSSLNIGKANALMNGGNLPKETTKLNAARNVQTLIDGIRSGEITDTKNVRAQLSNMIATIDFGTPGGVADRQAMGVDNLYSKLNDLKNKMTYDGKLSGTISPEYLSQLENEGHALGDRAAKNYAVGAQSILQGANLAGDDPDADPGQIHKLVTQRAKAFLTQNGYDPMTGAPLNRKSAGVKGGGMINSANADGPKTKMIGNDTYMKVDGGWQLVPPNGGQ